MRYLSWLTTLALLLVALVFTVNNTSDVTLSFWPFDVTATLPLAGLLFALLFGGYAVGCLVTWVAALPKYFENRRLRNEVLALQAKLDAAAALRETTKDGSPKWRFLQRILPRFRP